MAQVEMVQFKLWRAATAITSYIYKYSYGILWYKLKERQIHLPMLSVGKTPCILSNSLYITFILLLNNIKINNCSINLATVYSWKTLGY